MIQKQNFQEAIASLIELGYANDSMLTQADIHYYLKDILENESQYVPVYQFLKEKNIEIKNLSASPSQCIASGQPLDIASLPESERKYFTMYLGDLKQIRKLSESEMQELVQNYLKYPDKYMQPLTEQHLSLVTDMLAQYQHLSVRLGDILQEGNLGLMEGIRSYTGEMNLTEHLKQNILNAINRFIESESESNHISEHLLDRVNALEHASRVLAEEYGREATLQELAEYLHLPEEEIATVMKHSIDALNAEVEEEISNSASQK